MNTIRAAQLCILLAICPLPAQGAEPADAPMLMQLKVGDRVDLRSHSGRGYEVSVLDDRYIEAVKRTQPKYAPTTIVKVNPEYIVVKHKDDRGTFTRTIAAHAIDEILVMEFAEEKK